MITRMTIWKQGEYYKDLGESSISFNHKINPGPSDNLIKIVGINAMPDINGDYIQSIDQQRYSAEEMDAIRTFAIARKLINVIQNIINKPIKWQWSTKEDKTQLLIYIRNNGINTRYLRAQRCIELDYFGPYQNWTYYCRSADIVAHEVGHAILDGLKPGWYNSDIETRGIAEAFCDFCAMLLITTDLALCKEVIHETGQDFAKPNILSLFGAGYGYEETHHSCIRNAINSVQYRHDFSTVYDYSKLITGFLYDVLTKSMLTTGKQGKSPEITLFESAKPWANAVISAITKCSEEKTTGKEFCRHFQSSYYNKEVAVQSCTARNLN